MNNGDKNSCFSPAQVADKSEKWCEMCRGKQSPARGSINTGNKGFAPPILIQCGCGAALQCKLTIRMKSMCQYGQNVGDVSCRRRSRVEASRFSSAGTARDHKAKRWALFWSNPICAEVLGVIWTVSFYNRLPSLPNFVFIGEINGEGNFIFVLSMGRFWVSSYMHFFFSPRWVNISKTKANISCERTKR